MLSRDVDIVVNVRLASSRCPNKIIRNFAGTCLLNLAMQKISEIKNATNKYIAAGDDEIINQVKANKKICLLERSKLSVSAGEHDHKISFEHYASVKSPYIMILNPCLPFVKVSTYEKAIDVFQSNFDIKSLTSVIKYKDVFFDKNGKVFTLPNINHISTTTAEPIFKMAHAFHIVNKDDFISKGQFWDYSSLNPEYIEISHYESFDIDTEEDFEFCAKIYSGGFNG